MIGFGETLALKSMFGLTDEEIAMVQARLADILNLLHVYDTHADQIHRVLRDLSPIIQKALKKEQSL